MFGPGISELVLVLGDALVAMVLLSRFGVSIARTLGLWLGLTVGYLLLAFFVLGSIPGLFRLNVVALYALGLCVLVGLYAARTRFARYLTATPSYRTKPGEVMPWHWAIVAGLGVIGVPLALVVGVVTAFKRRAAVGRAE